MKRLLLFVLWWLLCAPSAFAHTPTMSVLTVKERAHGEFVTSWKRTQVIQDVGAAYDLLRPVFPEHCEFAPPRLSCGERGLTGRVGFDGLGDLNTAGMMELKWADGRTQLVNFSVAHPHVRLSGTAETAGSTATWSAFVAFVGVGVTHIWLGVDHLLFVLGLLWFVGSFRVLVKTITAFTVAHSCTLAAATLGFRVLPTAPVEATIALSIAFLAVEIAREARDGSPSVTRKHPWAVAFAFGLLHGFGFASALADLQIPRTELPLALLSFNVGVEVGQIAFVAVILALRPLWQRLHRLSGERAAMAAYYAMGTMAMYWFISRVAAFLPSV